MNFGVWLSIIAGIEWFLWSITNILDTRNVRLSIKSSKNKSCELNVNICQMKWYLEKAVQRKLIVTGGISININEKLT